MNQFGIAIKKEALENDLSASELELLNEADQIFSADEGTLFIFRDKIPEDIEPWKFSLRERDFILVDGGCYDDSYDAGTWDKNPWNLDREVSVNLTYTRHGDMQKPDVLIFKAPPDYYVRTGNKDIVVSMRSIGSARRAVIRAGVTLGSYSISSEMRDMCTKILDTCERLYPETKEQVAKARAGLYFPSNTDDIETAPSLTS